MRTESEVWEEALRELERVVVERYWRLQNMRARARHPWDEEVELSTTLDQDLRDRFEQRIARCEALRALSEQA